MSVVNRVAPLPVASWEDRERFVAGLSATAGYSPSSMLLKLISSFGEKDIKYCYWKSATRVERAMAGESDLDLLVDRGSRDRATALLCEHGFKPWPDAVGRGHPVIASFLGYEESCQAIRHVHVHFRLVLGHSLLKNFRLPIESRLIARSVLHPRFPLRLLDPADEALLLVVRYSLELSRIDPIALRQRSELERKYAEALAFVMTNVDPNELSRRARELFSAKTTNQIRETACSFGATLPRGAVRAAIARELAPYRTYNGLESSARIFARSTLFAASAVNRRLFRAPRAPRRRCPGGGVLISFVGVDGSGKSTQLAEVRKWLGAEIDVLTYYFGSGDGEPSLLFRPFKTISRSIAARIRVKPKGASHGKISDRPPGAIYSLMFVVWALAVALDKWIKLVSAQRAIARGFVVVTDRFPQNENVQFNDGPLLHRLTLAPAWLLRLESSVYEIAQRSPPDLVIKLQVGYATVANREPDMQPELISQKIEWLKDIKFADARVVSIDAKQSLAEVKRQVKRAIWDIF